MSPSRSVRALSLLAPAALALAGAASPALAGDGLGHHAELFFGPIIGGQPLRIDLRTSVPSTPFLLFFGADGTPTVPVTPATPPVGLNLVSSLQFLGSTGPTGRFQATVPSFPGQFGPGGFPLFFQALLVTQDGVRIASNVKATQAEPVPFGPDFLVETAASHLPAGSDDLDGATLDHADINRDGFPDLVIARSAGIAIWTNDGTGHFTDVTATAITMPGDSVSAIISGDVDGDSDIDLLTGGGFDDNISVPDRLWLNDGHGVFTLSAQLPAGVGLTHGMELADLDRDGDLDLLVAVGQEAHLPSSGGADRLLVNDGSGVFTEHAGFAAAAWNDPALSSQKVRVGDIESDGDLDIFLVRGSPAGENVLLRNDGNHVYTDVSVAQIQPLWTDNSQDAVFADHDGDGDLDILVANSVLGTPTDFSGDVLVNQGGAQLGTQGMFLDDDASFLEDSTVADAIRLGIAASDIDADGDVDVMVSVHDLFLGADHALFVNQGAAQGGTNGVMLRQTWYDPGDFISYGVALFDMDHDGDLDVLQTANGVITGDPVQQFQTRLFENLQL